jgi:hypothetical protein
VFFLCSENRHRQIEATSVDLCMFFVRIYEHKADITQLNFLVWTIWCLRVFFLSSESTKPTKPTLVMFSYFAIF